MVTLRDAHCRTANYPKVCSIMAPTRLKSASVATQATGKAAGAGLRSHIAAFECIDLDLHH
jgi:hypothetical protein